VEFRAIEGGSLRHVVSAAGDGPDVVLLHGFPDTPHSWADAQAALTGAGWRVTVPWLRGYHRDTITPGRRCDPETIGRDAIALLDAIGAQRAVLVGHDWGALIAYAAATLAPERVRALVGVAIPHPSVIPRTPRMVWAGRHFAALKMPWAAWACRRGDFAYLDELYRRWAPNWAGPEREASLRDAKEVFADAAVFDGALAYYRDLPVLPARLFARLPSVPALVVGGTADIVGPEVFTRTAALFPAPSRALIVDRAGHWAHREDPATVLPGILAFLAQIETATPAEGTARASR
jgi:pimeloyl-ACP methyl ester carboxylesterase